MKRLYYTWFCSLALLLVTTSAAHADDAALALLKTTTGSMITALTQNQAELKQDPLVVNRLVESILIPHVDFISASKWVLGKHWRSADKEQKLRFIKEFRSLMIRFYSSALADFLKTHEVRKDMIRFLPQRGESSEEVTIRSEVFAPDGKSIPVNYYMHNTRKGWKVYDVSVEGVSMVTTYRNSFANEIKLKGVDGLINSLAEKNNTAY